MEHSLKKGFGLRTGRGPERESLPALCWIVGLATRALFYNFQSLLYYARPRAKRYTADPRH